MRNDSLARLFASGHCLIYGFLLMEEEKEQTTIIDHSSEARIERLSRRDNSPALNSGYSKFVRIMRLALPLAAMAIVVILFLRMGAEEKLVVTTTTAQDTNSKKIARENIVQNELLNPRFESMDKRNNPYKITAQRAVQGEKNKDLIMLENPVGVMSMKDGIKITARSDTGAYRQDTERFFLQGNVFIEHGSGYSLSSEEAHIDLKQNFAWSEKDVQGIGSDMKINAKGISANGNTGQIIFKGPATLTLTNGLAGIK